MSSDVKVQTLAAEHFGSRTGRCRSVVGHPNNMLRSCMVRGRLLLVKRASRCSGDGDTRLSPSVHRAGAVGIDRCPDDFSMKTARTIMRTALHSQKRGSMAGPSPDCSNIAAKRLNRSGGDWRLRAAEGVSVASAHHIFHGRVDEHRSWQRTGMCMRSIRRRSGVATSARPQPPKAMREVRMAMRRDAAVLVHGSGCADVARAPPAIAHSTFTFP